MMDTQLGPRTIYYIDKDGSHQPITMKINFLDLEHIDLGTEIIVQTCGSISFECDWMIQPITILGQDKLQVIYGLMMIADSMLRRISKDTGLNLFKNIPGDITKPMDVFL